MLRAKNSQGGEIRDHRLNAYSICVEYLTFLKVDNES